MRFLRHTIANLSTRLSTGAHSGRASAQARSWWPDLISRTPAMPPSGTSPVQAHGRGLASEGAKLQLSFTVTCAQPGHTTYTDESALG